MPSTHANSNSGRNGGIKAHKAIDSMPVEPPLSDRNDTNRHEKENWHQEDNKVF